MVIYKYELNWEFPSTLELHSDYEILDIQEQNGVPVAWVLVDPDTRYAQVKIAPFFTGMHRTLPWYEHIKTLQRTDSPIVYHFFLV